MNRNSRAGRDLSALALSCAWEQKCFIAMADGSERKVSIPVAKSGLELEETLSWLREIDKA